MGKAHEDIRQTVHDLLQCCDHLLSLLHGLHLLDRISGIRRRYPIIIRIRQAFLADCVFASSSVFRDSSFSEIGLYGEHT